MDKNSLVWKSADVEAPKEYQDVIFIVESRDELSNGRMLGGRYQGFKFGYHEFSTPGIGWKASLWYPMPERPKQN